MAKCRWLKPPLPNFRFLFLLGISCSLNEESYRYVYRLECTKTLLLIVQFFLSLSFFLNQDQLFLSYKSLLLIVLFFLSLSFFLNQDQLFLSYKSLLLNVLFFLSLSIFLYQDQLFLSYFVFSSCLQVYTNLECLNTQLLLSSQPSQIRANENKETLIGLCLSNSLSSKVRGGQATLIWLFCSAQTTPMAPPWVVEPLPLPVPHQAKVVA